MRDKGDAHLLLHETTAGFLDTGRHLWCVMGDFEKAFPKTWRAHLIKQLADLVLVRDGMLASVGGVLETDAIHVNISGHSTVLAREGIPEGQGSLRKKDALHVWQLGEVYSRYQRENASKQRA